MFYRVVSLCRVLQTDIRELFYLYVWSWCLLAPFVRAIVFFPFLHCLRFHALFSQKCIVSLPVCGFQVFWKFLRFGVCFGYVGELNTVELVC